LSKPRRLSPPSFEGFEVTDTTAYFVLAGQSLIDNWFRQPGVLDAFKAEFLKYNPQYSDVQFFDAATGGSAILKSTAELNFQLNGNLKTETNYWYDETTGTPGPILASYESKLTSWAAGKTVLGIIWDQGQADTANVQSDALAAQYRAGLEYVLGKLKADSGALAIYIEGLGDRSTYSQRLHGGTETIRDIQKAYAAAHDFAHVLTTTFDLPLSDAVHPTDAGAITSAVRMADAISGIAASPDVNHAIMAADGTIYLTLNNSADQALLPLTSVDGFMLNGSAIASVTVDSNANVVVIHPVSVADQEHLEYAPPQISFQMTGSDMLLVDGPTGNLPVQPFDLDLSPSSIAIEAVGSAGSYDFEGTNGADVIVAFSGNDKLLGHAGNDTLDGRAGSDRLTGGTGDDTYYVDSYSDRVIENAGEGADSVFATASYKLGDNVEQLTLSGSANLYGYGNALDNALTGNNGINKLFGMEGNDTLDGEGGADRTTGGLGDDRYYVETYSDRVIEAADQGTDAIFSTSDFRLGANVEKLTLRGANDLWGYGNADHNVLTGNTGANKLYGLGGSDTLSGGSGNDWLEGGAGQDKLNGGSGNDSFVFRVGDFGGSTTGTADLIQDFTHGEDHIRLNFVDANSTLSGDQAFQFMGAGSFDGHAGELRYEEISGNTYISGDTNGDGTADFMIRVDGLHELASSDFVL
jgi:Ca2+-binding RTX toxin-like protein